MTDLIEVERIPAPRNEPTANLTDEWGYFVFYSDGTNAFIKGKVSNQTKIHALKTIYLIEV